MSKISICIETTTLLQIVLTFSQNNPMRVHIASCVVQYVRSEAIKLISKPDIYKYTKIYMLTSTSAFYYENTVFCHVDYVTNLTL